MKYLTKDERFLVLIGPSGSGKSRLVSELVADGLLELTPSWTTRPLRLNEAGDITHHFVSESEFETRKQEGFFLETQKLFGLGYQYGLPKFTHNNPQAVACVVLRANLIPLLRKHYSNPIIYHIEVDPATARQHIVARQGDTADARQRLVAFDAEVKAGRDIANRSFVNNGPFSRLKQQVQRSLGHDFPVLS